MNLCMILIEWIKGRNTIIGSKIWWTKMTINESVLMRWTMINKVLIMLEIKNKKCSSNYRQRTSILFVANPYIFRSRGMGLAGWRIGKYSISTHLKNVFLLLMILPFLHYWFTAIFCGVRFNFDGTRSWNDNGFLDDLYLTLRYKVVLVLLYEPSRYWSMRRLPLPSPHQDLQWHQRSAPGASKDLKLLCQK